MLCTFGKRTFPLKIAFYSKAAFGGKLETLLIRHVLESDYSMLLWEMSLLHLATGVNFYNEPLRRELHWHLLFQKLNWHQYFEKPVTIQSIFPGFRVKSGIALLRRMGKPHLPHLACLYLPRWCDSIPVKLQRPLWLVAAASQNWLHVPHPSSNMTSVFLDGKAEDGMGK